VPKEAEIKEPRLSVKPEENEPARPGEEDSRKDDQRGSDPLELEVEDQPDREEGNRQHNAQLFFRPDLVLVAARKLVANACGNFQLARGNFVLEKGLRLFHHFDLSVTVALVEDNVTYQKCVLALDHLRTAHVVDRGQLAQRDLRPIRGRHEDFFDALNRVPQLTLVTNPHGITLAAFHRHRDRFAADCDFDYVLHHCDFDTVAGDRLAVDVDLQVWLADDAVGKNGFRADRGHLFEERLDLEGHIFERFEIGSKHLQPHRRPHATLQHDNAGRDRLEFRGGGRAKNARGGDDFLPDIVGTLNMITPLAERPAILVGDQLALRVALEGLGVLIVGEAKNATRFVSDVFRFVVYDRLHHRDRGRIKRALHPPQFAHRRFHFGNGIDRHILLAQHIHCFAN